MSFTRLLKITVPIILLGAGIIAYSCAVTNTNRERILELWYPEDDQALGKTMYEVIEILKPLHRKLGKPESGDWLAEHNEPGQTFEEYVRCRPERPIGERRTLYIQPIGHFTEKQRQIVKLSAEFMGLYYNRPVKFLDDLPLSVIPRNSRRFKFGSEQILTSYILEYVLPKRLPNDGAVCIAFTASDLWPGGKWNFVYGQATTRNRVGVWSIHRNGNPASSKAAYRLCLLRTMKTATHETGHMFTMYHCTKYECNMCGSNHRQESDSRPLACCPECVTKVCWAVRCRLIPRYEKLAAFCEKHGLEKERKFYLRSIKALKDADKSEDMDGK